MDALRKYFCSSFNLISRLYNIHPSSFLSYSIKKRHQSRQTDKRTFLSQVASNKTQQTRQLFTANDPSFNFCPEMIILRKFHQSFFISLHIFNSCHLLNNSTFLVLLAFLILSKFSYLCKFLMLLRFSILPTFSMFPTFQF